MNAEFPDAFAPALPLAGEGAPTLLVAALAAMGATLAVVSATIWLTPPVTPPKPLTIVVRETAPPPPPTIVQVPAPAPPPTIIRVPAEPAPPPCFDLVTLMFATSKSEPLIVTDADRARLRADVARLSGWLNQHANAKLLIEGHADATGTEAQNLVLSFARAKATSSLLSSNGIPAGRMTVRAAGAGEAALKIDPRDRRVDVSIEGVAACKSATDAKEHP
jgi:outer membrane protein OmpA-like peptidoglycan-associated protein